MVSKCKYTVQTAQKYTQIHAHTHTRTHLGLQEAKFIQKVRCLVAEKPLNALLFLFPPRSYFHRGRHEKTERLSLSLTERLLILC